MAEPSPPMHTHCTPAAALWCHWRAPRERWIRDDNPVHVRVARLILSEGLLFSAYAMPSTILPRWLAWGLARVREAAATPGGTGTVAALSACAAIRRQPNGARPADRCPHAPEGRSTRRGRWAARSRTWSAPRPGCLRRRTRFVSEGLR